MRFLCPKNDSKAKAGSFLPPALLSSLFYRSVYDFSIAHKKP